MKKTYSEQEILQVLKEIERIDNVNGHIAIQCFGMKGQIGIANFVEGSFTYDLLKLIYKHMDLK